MIRRIGLISSVAMLLSVAMHQPNHTLGPRLGGSEAARGIRVDATIARFNRFKDLNCIRRFAANRAEL